METLKSDRYRNSAIPHIMINGATDAIEFYKTAFDAQEVFRIANGLGKIMHAEITIEGIIVMLGDAKGIFKGPQTLGATTVSVHLYVKDADALFNRAVSAGAKVIMNMQDMFYGDRMGMLQDPYGHVWVLLTHQKEMSPEEIVLAANSLFS